MECFELGGFHLGKVNAAGSKPLTLKLIASSVYMLDPLLFGLKLKYDHVRPSYADPILRPDVEVPGHPSFPSGHAAQAMLVAEILSSFRPQQRVAFVRDAERIARNREVAGLHYPSDTAAGFELAGVFYRRLQSQRWYVALRERAEGEWQPDR